MKKSPFKFAVIITLIVVVLLVAIFLLNNKDTANEGDGEQAEITKQPSIEGQPVMGDENAPVTIVEFGDFMCPACKTWGQNHLQQLMEDYVDTGKVKFSFINVLFHGEESKLGSLAAESILKQNPDAYWDFHNALFNAQPDENKEWMTTDKLLEIEEDIPEIDSEKLKSSLKDESEIAELSKDTELVKDYGIELTPSIMVNGKMIEDPFNYEQITNAINKALEEEK